MADGHRLENRKSAIYTQWFDRLERNLARLCTLALRTLLAFKILQTQDGGQPPSCKIQRTAISRQRLDRSARYIM